MTMTKSINLDEIRRTLEARHMTGDSWRVTSGGKFFDGHMTTHAASEAAAIEKVAIAIADGAAKGIPPWELPDEIA